MTQPNFEEMEQHLEFLEKRGTNFTTLCEMLESEIINSNSEFNNPSMEKLFLALSILTTARVELTIVWDKQTKLFEEAQKEEENVSES